MYRVLAAALAVFTISGAARADEDESSTLLFSRDLSSAERSYYGTVLMNAARVAPSECVPDKYGYEKTPEYGEPTSFSPMEGDLLDVGVFPNRFDLHLYCNSEGERMISVSPFPRLASKTSFVKRVIEQGDGYLLYEHEYEGVVGLWVDARSPAGAKSSPNRGAPITSIDFSFFLGGIEEGTTAARKLDIAAVRAAMAMGAPPEPEEVPSNPCRSDRDPALAGTLADLPTRNREQAAVFETVLQHSIRHGAQGQLVMLKPEPFELDSSGRVSALTLPLCALQDVVDDFAVRARETTWFSKRALRERGFEAMTSQELQQRIPKKAAKRDYWKALHAAFPRTNGVAEFSQVGFNKELTQAMVYVSWYRAMVWGAGDLYVLEKKRGRWRVAYFSHLWAS